MTTWCVFDLRSLMKYRIAMLHCAAIALHVCIYVQQRAHIPKAIMSVLEKDANEQKVVENARRVEEERLTQQEKLYQVSHKICLYS